MEHLTLGDALKADEYALIQMYVEFKEGMHNEIVCDDYFFRKLPFGNGYAVYVGLDRFIDYLQNLCFTDRDLQWVRTKIKDEAFLDELKRLRFTGNVWAMREGEVVFPNQPIIRVEARSIEAYLIELYMLATNNHETLIATKASRIRQVLLNHATRPFQLFELGGRRAHGTEAAVRCSRAAYIAGFDKTSNMEASARYGIPSTGTMAHRFVQRFEGRGGQLEAFRTFARWRPDNTVLLVDTYDVLASGIPDAITVAKELKQRGHRLLGVRIDSGDIPYLAREARRMLDEAGLDYVKIVASGDLDEYLINDLLTQDVPIDVWGVGTKLVTGDGNPALGGVDKIVAQQVDDVWMPLIKISETIMKTTTPGRKNVWRVFDRRTGKALGDYVTLFDENPLQLGTTLHNDLLRRYGNDVNVEPLLQPIVMNGVMVTKPVDAHEAREYHMQRLNCFDLEYRLMKNSNTYPVKLSPDIEQLKFNLTRRKRNIDSTRFRSVVLC